jgi:hypothetical protein
VISQSLNSTGEFIIDYLNVPYAEDNLIKNESKNIEGIIFNISRWQNETHFFKKIDIQHSQRSLKYSYTEKVTKFSLDDFIEMLAQQNLHIKNVYGNYELEEYNLKRSPRMIIRAKK